MNTITKQFTENNYVKKSNLIEDIEKHEKLNPKLWTNNKLKTKILEKINTIVEEFSDSLADDNIKISIKDIVIIGSNASYNYTANSDLDIHIIVDNKGKTKKLLTAVYNAYRSIFNNKYSINFYGIPVEIFVETSEMTTISNGIYSVKYNKWLRAPNYIKIPDIDQNKITQEFKKWEQRYKQIYNKKNKLTNTNTIDTLITDIYDLRQNSLKTGNEYSTGNLIFKEFRNYGYLDNLKELKNKIMSKKLSLKESVVCMNGYRINNTPDYATKYNFIVARFVDDELYFYGAYNEEDRAFEIAHELDGGIAIPNKNCHLEETFIEIKKLASYKMQIQRCVRYPVEVQQDGKFTISNIDEFDSLNVKHALDKLPFIKSYNETAGKYDFTKPFIGKMPKRYITIYGFITD